MNSLIDLPEFFVPRSKILLVDGLQGAEGSVSAPTGQSGQWWWGPCVRSSAGHSQLCPRPGGLPGLYPSSSSLRSCLRGRTVHCFVFTVTLTLFSVSKLSPQSLVWFKAQFPSFASSTGDVSQNSDLLPCPPLIPFTWFTSSLAQSV